MPIAESLLNSTQTVPIDGAGGLGLEAVEGMEYFSIMAMDGLAWKVIFLRLGGHPCQLSCSRGARDVGLTPGYHWGRHIVIGSRQVIFVLPLLLAHSPLQEMSVSSPVFDVRH